MAEKYFKIRKDMNAIADEYKKKIEALLAEDEGVDEKGPYNVSFMIQVNLNQNRCRDNDFEIYIGENVLCSLPRCEKRWSTTFKD